MPLEQKLNQYLALLNKWQKTINLVSSDTLAEARTRHFDDSLQLVPLIPVEAKVLADIGSGAGFPGLVLAMARPDLEVHLIESDARKAAFLMTVSRETETTNLRVHVKRAEDILPALKPEVITARALAALDKLLAMTQPVWNDNQLITLIFPKGSHYAAEVESARQSYDFDLAVTPSRTDKNAAILRLHSVKTL